MNDLGEKFWSRVDITPHCWEWTGSHTAAGYGLFYVPGRRGMKSPAHRIAYEALSGPIPGDLIVRHRCDNPPCVNPAHLEIGTHGDNARDKVERGRQPRGEDNGLARLTAADIREIRASTELQVDLAGRFGVSQSCISNILTRRTWRHVA